jgi:N-dimethylarginine dimethylaminohydrolase
MCRPSYYGIEYEINPWMDIQRQANRTRAIGQWQTLRKVLEEEIGARVVTCRARPGLPDMCFTANAGLVKDGTFVPSRFRYRERAREEQHFTRWFSRRGYRIIHLPQEYHFEGAGDAVVAGDLLFAGYYFRSDVHTHGFIEETLGIRTLSLALVDRRFYHLDTCFAPIGPSSAIVYPGAFDRYSLKVLKSNLTDLLEVSLEEALQFACNAVIVADKAVIPRSCRGLAADLEKRGFTLYPLDLSEFMKAGGAAKCLTLGIG